MHTLDCLRIFNIDFTNHINSCVAPFKVNSNVKSHIRSEYQHVGAHKKSAIVVFTSSFIHSPQTIPSHCDSSSLMSPWNVLPTRRPELVLLRLILRAIPPTHQFYCQLCVRTRRRVTVNVNNEQREEKGKRRNASINICRIVSYQSAGSCQTALFMDDKCHKTTHQASQESN